MKIKAYSPLISKYIENHPQEVAALLEGEPIADVKKFFERLPHNEHSYLLPYISMKYLTATASEITEDDFKILLENQPFFVGLRIYNALSKEQKNSIFPQLPRRFQWYIRYTETQKSRSVTTIMSYDFISLPENMKIDKARSSIKRKRQRIQAIFTHDEKNKITGEVQLASLYEENKNDTLADCKNIVKYKQHSSSTIDDIKILNIWEKTNVLPIIDDDNHILGIVLINDLYEEIIHEEHALKQSIYGGIEQITQAIYSTLSTLASFYKKGA